MARLFLVRHGETELKSSERYWGATDVALSALGLEQAARLRERLASEKIDAIYASPLARARTTAELIASRHGLGVTICPELREIDFGQLEGLTFSEIEQRFPDVAGLWKKRTLKLVFPGGDAVATFNRRVSRFTKRLEKHTAGETLLVVAHNGPLRTLICRLLGIGLEHRWRFRLELASLSIIETYSPGGVLRLLNDVSHLKCL
ncbi:MAG: alpha-ribazole phosphatase [Dehalococcoidia bacterium]|jgi:alpha-ribazole phosphatase|nr:MAG: alpha-ribazole phosphatase [Dehalococcoidia bacterium]